MIPLDRHDRYSRVFDHFETLDRVVHRFGRHRTLVKKVAAHQHKIDLFFDRVAPQHIGPGVKKIPRAFGKLIPCAPEMHIGNMQKLHTGILPLIHRYNESLSGSGPELSK